MNKVLVIIGYTDFKYYCRPLFPKIYNILTFKEKDILFVTDENYPGLSNMDSGDIVCAKIREYGIAKAIKEGYEWVFLLDIDAIPDADIIEKLMECKHPIAGAVVACRGDSTKIIGHMYKDRKTMERIPLDFISGYGVYTVDGTSGAAMLIHRSVFTKADYSGYKGVDTIKGRTTCDDEYFLLQAYKKTGIKPKLNLMARVWHLHNDGFAYKWYGGKKQFKRINDTIKFEGRTYDGK